jgi:hypothetical protein
VLTEDYQLRESREPAVFNFITQACADIGAAGVIQLRTHLGAAALLHFDITQLEAKIETKAITDPQLASSWGGQVHRIRLVERAAVCAARHKFHLTRPPTHPTP